MSQAISRLEELSEAEARHLLGYGSYVGHVGFVQDGTPMILPVNYLYDDESIVFRTAEGTPLDRIEGQAVVFEVDTNRPLETAGWSVLAHGTVERITDETTVDRLGRGPLRSWAWLGANQWFRITVERISGRRIPES
ncbi:MAG: pyridoxamine 5'-phosphate oxidase family protein [Candidatus Dormibacteraeota bacterium]|nr:pyridoxamine 5'-phosphate oxidase family protein [Candidatus Dormibacteraeota bacterium]